MGATLKEKIITVTEGTTFLGITYWGFDDGSIDLSAFGSIDIPTIDGSVVISRIAANSLGAGAFERFQVILAGNRPRNYFENILPQGGVKLFTVSSLAFAYDGPSDTTRWGWDTPVPTGWDGTGTRTATFNYF